MHRASGVLSVAIFLVVALACSTSVVGCRRSKSPVRVSMATCIGKAERPIIAIYVDAIGLAVGSEDGPQVILAVWEDGSVIWSENRLEGGQPYFSGKIPREKIESFFKSLSKIHAFKKPISHRSLIAPDSRYTVIAILRGTEQLNMESMHELAEANPNLVGTAHGILALEGRSPEEVWAEQPRWYKHFHDIWADIRSAADALIPAEGKPSQDLHFRIKHFSISIAEE